MADGVGSSPWAENGDCYANTDLEKDSTLQKREKLPESNDTMPCCTSRFSSP